MLTVAYLANQYPSAVEPYVVEEISELRRRGVRVIAGSARRCATENGERSAAQPDPDVSLQPIQGIVLFRAIWLCVRRWRCIAPLLGRILFSGSEGPLTRLKALAHTLLGAYYAVRLERFDVGHIHVHHGYFGSWIAMAAARLLGVQFSMTLHGSDLLLHGTYLDVKLAHCTLCLTVSDYNRQYILQHYPAVKAEKVMVSRMGVDATTRTPTPGRNSTQKHPFTILAVGRLHSVKDHAFLIRACAQLCDLNFECLIAGDGPEWSNLQNLVREYDLQQRVGLLGHVERKHLDRFYEQADVIVLTSRSEGIPLVLMEAMARRKIVLAPAITGIPELVIAGKTGFLYAPGSLDDFVSQLRGIRLMMRAPEDGHLRPYILSGNQELRQMMEAAEQHVREHFNRSRNLEVFGDLFLQHIASVMESTPDENLVLQQV